MQGNNSIAMVFKKTTIILNTLSNREDSKILSYPVLTMYQIYNPHLNINHLKVYQSLTLLQRGKA
jgi:hypothetical protein